MPLGLAGSASGVPVGPQYCAPPSWFRGVEGVRSAWPQSGGPFGRTPARLRGSVAQRQGKRYERKVLEYLSEVLGDRFRASQWFKFEDNSGDFRWCQLDGILHTTFGTVIFEVKYTFTSDAWWQIRHLYEPIVKKIYGRPIAAAIVCKNFDPAVPFPEPHILLPSVSGLQNSLERDRTYVVRWRP